MNTCRFLRLSSRTNADALGMDSSIGSIAWILLISDRNQHPVPRGSPQRTSIVRTRTPEASMATSPKSRSNSRETQGGLPRRVFRCPATYLDQGPRSYRATRRERSESTEGAASYAPHSKTRRPTGFPEAGSGISESRPHRWRRTTKVWDGTRAEWLPRLRDERKRRWRILMFSPWEWTYTRIRRSQCHLARLLVWTERLRRQSLITRNLIP